MGVWRCTVRRNGADTEMSVRQDSANFQAAKALDEMIAQALRSGDAQGHVHCERKVLGALKSA